jgi:tetratricopeptide (TPR) repeat protein
LSNGQKVSISHGIEFAYSWASVHSKEESMTPQTTLMIYNTTMSAQDLIAKAEQLDHAGKTHEALELYRHWLKHDRTHSKYSVWFNYGWLLQKQNLQEEASQAYDQVINCYADHLHRTAEANTSAAYA